MRKLLISATMAALFIAPSLAETIGSGMADGTRYDAPAYNTIGVQAGNPVQCREACRGDLRCLAWNYERPMSGSASSQCQLLDRVPTLVWDDNFISGEIGRSQPAPDPDEHITPGTPGGQPMPPVPPSPPGPESASLWDHFTMSEGMEASGGAYSSWTYVAKGDGGLTKCAQACDTDSKCRGFVVRSDPETAPKPNVVCELKSAPGSLLRNPDATTGMKR